MPAPTFGGMFTLILLGVVGIAFLVFLLVIFNFIGIWIRAQVARAPVGLLTMVAMRLRRVPVSMIVDMRVTAMKAGIDINTDFLEAHFLAGGSVDQVVLALIAADKAGIVLDFNRACAIDLASKPG